MSPRCCVWQSDWSEAGAWSTSHTKSHRKVCSQHDTCLGLCSCGSIVRKLAEFPGLAINQRWLRWGTAFGWKNHKIVNILWLYSRKSTCPMMDRCKVLNLRWSKLQGQSLRLRTKWKLSVQQTVPSRNIWIAMCLLVLSFQAGSQPWIWPGNRSVWSLWQVNSLPTPTKNAQTMFPAKWTAVWLQQVELWTQPCQQRASLSHHRPAVCRNNTVSETQAHKRATELCTLTPKNN